MPEFDYDIYEKLFIVLFSIWVIINIIWISQFVYILLTNIQQITSRIKRIRFRNAWKLIINKFIIFNTLLPLTLGIIIFVAFNYGTPRIEESSPGNEGQWLSYNDPIEVKFNKPVSTARLNPNINPQIEGEWKWDSYFGIKALTRKGRFYPAKSLYEDTRIVVYITGVRRPKTNENHEHGFVFDSVKMPEVKYSQPFNNSFDINQDSEIILYLNKADEDLVDWQFNFTPELDYDIVSETSKKIVLKPKNNLQQNTKYQLEIERIAKIINLDDSGVIERDNAELVSRINFNTVKEPLVKRFNPKGTGIKQDAKIKIVFEVPVIRTSAEQRMTISPNLEGEITWEDDKTLIFTPANSLPKETTFKVGFAKGIESKTGGITENDFDFSFTTIGYVRTLGNSPTNGQVRVNETTDIKFQFDQEVDQTSAQNNFRINPNIAGNFSWEGNTLIFKPNGSLNYGTQYTVSMEAGVKSIFGLDSKDKFEFTFTTRTNQYIIGNVPLYYQPQPSVMCNIFTARMALAWKGYTTEPLSLISEIGYNSNQVNGNWAGDPNKQFIGGSDGIWGYGVHWYPIQRLFNNRGLSTDLKLGWNIYELAQAVENNKPVIIWRYNGESANYDRDWTAQDGTYVDAINGQHGGVIIGFMGTSDNPTHFLVNDPWYGQIWLSSSTFDYYWSRLGRVGLVIN